MYASLTSRKAGRASLLIVFGLALVFCGGVVFYFVYPPLPEPLFDDEVPAGEADGTTGDSRVSNGGPVAPKAGPGPSGTKSPEGTEVTSPGQIEKTALRIFGKVTDIGDQPVAGMSLRWFPASASDLKRHLHDAAVVGKSPHSTVLPEGKVRTALEQSEVTSSDEDGGYEFRLEDRNAGGVVIASGPGYETQIRPVSPDEGKSEEPAAAETDKDFSSDVEINFQLRSASSISGKVTDKMTGEPAEGMFVIAGVMDREKPEMFSFVPAGAPRATVGKDGFYEIQGLRPGNYRVVPRTGRSDYASVSSRTVEESVLEAGIDLTDVDFRVDPGARIYGVVSSPDGKPLAGVKCSVFPSDFMSMAARGDMEMLGVIQKRRSVTDADGYFEIRGVSPGMAYLVLGRAKDYAPGTSPEVEIGKEQFEAEVNFSLTEGHSISGHVVDASDNPVPGIQVHIVPNLKDLAAGNVAAMRGVATRKVTDDAGAFTFENLPAGRFPLRAGKLRPQDIMGASDSTVGVTLDGATDVSGVVLTLESDGGMEVAGIVLDDTGAPIEGVEVKISGALDVGGTSAKSVTTGPDGRFHADKLSGDLFNLTASKDNHARSTVKSVAANNRDVLVTLDRFGRLSGRIFAPDDAPVGEGGKVRARPVKKESALEKIMNMAYLLGQKKLSKDIAADGTFSFEVPPGELEVEAAVPGFAPGLSRPIDVAPGGVYEGIKIQITVGSVLQGKIIGPAQQVLEKATVKVLPVTADGEADMIRKMLPQFFAQEGRGAVSDADGVYEVRHLAAGTYKVTAHHKGYASSKPVTVNLREDQLWQLEPLVLTEGATLVCSVVEEEKPRAGMMVQLMSESPLKQGFTNREGRFRFEGLEPGEYLVNIIDLALMQSGKGGMKQRVVALEEGESRELEVVFGIGVSISGTIKGLPPAPMRMVNLRRPGGPLPEEVKPMDMKAAVEAGKYQAGIGFVSQDGKYKIDDVEPGKYVLEIPRMPDNPGDLQALAEMDRTPHYRREIIVRDRDITRDIEIE